MKRKSGSQVQAEAVELIEGAGFDSAGHTECETVRVPTRRAPVFGGCGGEVRIFGGRLRFALGDRRVTVGPRTVNFYTMGSNGPTDFVQFKTRDVEGISRHLQQQRPPEKGSGGHGSIENENR